MIIKFQFEEISKERERDNLCNVIEKGGMKTKTLKGRVREA